MVSPLDCITAKTVRKAWTVKITERIPLLFCDGSEQLNDKMKRLIQSVFVKTPTDKKENVNYNKDNNSIANPVFFIDDCAGKSNTFKNTRAYDFIMLLS